MLVAILGFGWGGRDAHAGTLSAVTPMGASSGVSLSITGTGFSTTASNNEVTFTASSGTSAIANAATVTTLDATTGLRRLTLTVPAGLPVGTTALRVRNTTTGELSEGRSVEIIAIGLPGITSAPRGTTGLAVRITGSPNAQFVSGARAAFGSGVTVTATTVESPTSLVATITIAATAALGPRNVGVITSTQTAVVTGIFTILEAGAVNRAPTAQAGGPYSGVAGEPITFTGSGSDPDNDPLRFTWNFDGTVVAANPATHTYAVAGTFTARLTVDDGRGGSATADAAVTVNAAPPPNQLPQITSQPGTLGVEGQVYFYQIAATDPDGEAVVFSLVQGPSGMVVAVDTGLLTWTPSSAQIGNHPVSVSATDPRDGTTTQSFAIDVTAANRLPVITSSANVSAIEARPYDYQVVATDPDNDLLTYALAEFPAGMTVDATGLITWTPGADQVGPQAVRVQVTDDRGGAATQAFTIVVTAANRLPVITSSPGLSASEARPYNYQVVATDPDSDPLTYTLTVSPAGMAISAAGLIGWTPAATDVGPQAVGVRVSDGRGGVADQSFTVDVTANGLPVITSQPLLTAIEAALYEYHVTATDPDGDPLTFTLAEFPTGLTIDAAGLIAWIPAVDQVAPQAVRVQVTDDRGGASSQAFTITVTAFNRPPRITSSPVTTAREQLPYAYAVAATDFNGDHLTFTLTEFPLGMTIAADGLIAWTPAAPDVGAHPVTVMVSDGAAASDVQHFEIVVTAAPRINRAPQITSQPLVSAQEGQAYAYPVTATDLDGDALGFTLTQAPTGMTIVGDGRIAWTPSAGQVGGHAVVIVVSDETDTASQAYEVSVAGAAVVNRPPAAHPGGPYQGQVDAAIAFSAAASSDPDGDPLSVTWDFGDQSTGAQDMTPSHTYSQPGTFTVTVTVSDGRGGVDHRSTSAVVGAAGDRAPPTVSLVGPREVLPGEQITLTAQAVDNVRVESVTFDVNGADPTTVTTPPYQRAMTIPPVASPGATINVRAVAQDPSGNAGTADAIVTVVARPDTEAPVVTVQFPPLAAPGATIRLSAGATDNAGVASVVFSVNGVVVLTVDQSPYEAGYLISPDAPAGSTLAVTARAVDFAGNRGEARGSIAVVPSPDTTPPTVQLSARNTVLPGSLLTLSAAAADNRGVSAVTFYVDGGQIATDTQAPYDAVFPVSESTQPGTVLRLEARATDFSGLEATDARQTDVLALSSLGHGALAGEVYDGRSGLALEGVAIVLTGHDAGDQPYSQSTMSDHRGRYVVRAVEGQGVLRFTKPGWTAIDRSVEIIGDRSIEVLDVRLIPASNGSALTAVLGGRVASAATVLDVPAGSLRQSETLAVTAVSQQGIAGPLPLGWSPMAAVDVTPHHVVFDAPATLTTPTPFSIDGAAPLVVARWDEASTAWRAVATGVRGSGPLSAAITESGQYAWLLADTVPAAPPVPVIGATLSGVSPMPVPVDATATVAPQPRIVFYHPGVHADVRGTITSPTPLPSGTLLFTTITESYTFLSGAEMHPEPSVQDIVLYQVPGASASLEAAYPVTPSMTFEALTFQTGVITVELFAPASGARQTDLLGAQGGTVAASTGEAVQIPAGSVVDPVPVVVRGLTVTQIGLPIPAGLEFVGALSVSFSGAPLAGPVVLSVPRPAQVAAPDQVLLARIQELDGETRLVLVAVGRIEGDRVMSETGLVGVDGVFEGVRAGGRYVFVRPAVPIGFARGTVLGVAGAAFPSALISADTVEVVALSGASGAYVAAAGVGAVTLGAMDLEKRDTGSAQTTIAGAGAVVVADLRLGAQPPRLVSISPVADADNVPLSNPIVLTFSEPLAPSTVTAQAVELIGPDGAAVPVSLTLSGNNSIITLRPIDPLIANARFTVTAAQTITDLSGYGLEAAVLSRFTSLDTAPPPPPVAGSITAAIPGPDGRTTVTGTQGTAGPHDTVSIINLTRGTSTPALVDPNGGFSVILNVGLTDKLQILIVDQAGNETVAPLARFTQVNADGSVSAAVDTDGGRIEGPGGVVVDVPTGAFPDGAVVTVKPVAEADFPVQLSIEQKEFFGYSGGVDLDFGGATPTRYVNVSVPAGPDDAATDQWIVGQVVDVGGQPQLNIIDTAKLINGRVTTSSPPCPGVTGRGVYGFQKSRRAVGLNYGVMYSAGGGGLVASVEYPSLGAIAFPFLALSYEFPAPVCLPILTGRVTVTENSLEISIPPSQLYPVDREVVVKDITRETEFHFPRNVIEYAFTVRGRESDSYHVSVRDAGGTETPLTFFQVSAVSPESVSVRLDMDKITVSAAQIIIKNVTPNPVQVNTFGVAGLALTLKVAGLASDTFEITAIDVNGVARPVTTFDVVPPAPPLDSGNLLVRAITGTIDPTPDQIAAHNAQYPDDQILGAGVVGVRLINDTTSDIVPIDLATIQDGGFVRAFNGAITDSYAIEVRYEDGKIDSRSIPNFRIVVRNALTGRVIKTITGQAPPTGSPLNVGTITNDTTPPLVIAGPPRLSNLDPTAPLSFTFSEPMDSATVNAATFIVEQLTASLSYVPVEGTVTLSPDGRVATFTPKTGLRLGEDYRIRFDGMKDLAGKALLYQPIRFATYKPKRICPTTGPVNCSLSLTTGSDGRPLESIKDVEILRKTVGGTLRTQVVAVTDTRDANKLLTFDVTDPANPVELGFAGGGNMRKRVTLLRNVDFALRTRIVAGVETPLENPCTPGSLRFTGDMAVTTAWNTYYGYVGFYDVTNPTAPCLLGNKLLTATPDTLSDYNRRGTIHALGFARGVATIQHEASTQYKAGYAVYVAVGEVGLMWADIGSNIPEELPTERTKAAVYPGDYFDVIAVSDRLLAVEKSASKLDLFDPNLTLLTSVDLPDHPRRMVRAEGFPVDANADGAISADEIRDLVFIGGDRTIQIVDSAGVLQTVVIGSIQIVDITDINNPAIIGSVRMPGIVRDLDVDVSRQRVFAGGERGAVGGTSGMAFFMVDVSNPTLSGLIDNDGDPEHLDDRIVWKQDYPYAVNGFRIDRERGLAYIGVFDGSGTGAAPKGGLDIFAIDDTCCDLGVDFAAERVEKPSGPRDELLKAEKAALQQGIAAGLDVAGPQCGVGAHLAEARIAILEQGSGACVWNGRCDGTYQPGLSDHDFEVFFPGSMLPPVQTPIDPAVTCTIQKLTDQFQDEHGNPKEFVINGRTLSFADVTFYPLAREPFENAQLDVGPLPGIGADSDGDMGLGRQQLLLGKFLLEGEYVDVPKYIVGGRNLLKGRSQDAILARLRQFTGIPLLEGYEWAVLQQYGLLKSKALIRVKGASDRNSAFHELYIKQLHDAGKAGIRAAMARMVADPAANKRLFSHGRGSYSIFACFDVIPAVAPDQWNRKGCTSFEEFVAGFAIDEYLTREALGEPVLFTLDEILTVHRFYRMKADRELPANETDADNFIAGVARFIQQVQTVTKPIYDGAIGSDPSSAQRIANRDKALGKIDKVVKEGSLHVVPRVFNVGFKDGDLVRLAMYRDVDAPNTGQPVKEIALDVPASSERFLRYEGDLAPAPGEDASSAERIFLDLSRTASADRDKFFVLGEAPTGPNQYIPLDTDFGQPHGVAFTIDLPAHKTKEANRQNNLGGFYYYVLDWQNPGLVVPSTAPKPPLPLPDPDGDLLQPDPACDDAAKLTVIQSANNDLIRFTISNNSTETMTNVTVCSDAGLGCTAPITLAAGSAQTVQLPFADPPEASVVDSRATVYALDSHGRTVQLVYSAQLSNVASPIAVALYDHTPLLDLNHPFSRFLLNHNSLAVQQPIIGAVTDGQEQSIRISISGLKPSTSAEVSIQDALLTGVTAGIGRLHVGTVAGTDVTVTADMLGRAELFYTPPSVFVRNSHRKFDFDETERQVDLTVHQTDVGTSSATINLRRPPVFLVHGLFGNIHVWKNFQPLVPLGGQLNLIVADVTQSDATYYKSREGFDGRFDLFTVGAPNARGRFTAGAEAVKQDIGHSLAFYLPGYAIGKVDLFGHSMGGVLSRKLTNEDPVVRNAVRKLIIMNSPMGGSPVADKVVEIRSQVPLDFKPGEVIDFFKAEPGLMTSWSDSLKDTVKLDWCAALFNTIGRTPALDVYSGGLDDLQTRLTNPDGTPTEIARLIAGGFQVPTHLLVDQTTMLSGWLGLPALGFSTEVSGMWVALGLFCNLTPEHDTVESTKLLRIGAEAVKTLVPIFKAARATKTRTGGAFSSGKSKAILLDLLEGTVKKGVEELFIGDDPKPVFTTPNDRVVPYPSQFGTGINGMGGLTPGSPAVTDVSGHTDHQAAKITPGITTDQCVTVDSAGVPQFTDMPIHDLNGDDHPDPTCRVIRLLEEDPAGALFYQGP